MPKNVLLTADQKQLNADLYAELLAKGMKPGAIEDVLAVQLGISPRTVREYRNYNIADEPQLPSAEQIDEIIKGTSTLYDADGKVKLKWVKADKKQDTERFKEWAVALSADLAKVEPRPTNLKEYEDLLTAIPFGDPHFGLFANALESGDDFNLDIAERDLCQAVDYLVKSTPPSKECLIANLGDMLHFDNNSGETSRGHNKLDTDKRWSQVLVIGLKAIRQCITSALEHHEKVTVINAIGNHDDHSSIFLTIALANIYENEPRVNIIDRPTIIHYYRFGKNLIGVHHGHTIKPQDLPLIMATDRPQDWGECPNRVFLCGHLHQTIKREYQGVTVETFRTLAPRDSWAASMGYRSGRDMNAIIYHREYGEVSRHLVSVNMLRTMQEMV